MAKKAAPAKKGGLNSNVTDKNAASTLATLQARQQAGNISPNDLKRLNDLQGKYPNGAPAAPAPQANERAPNPKLSNVQTGNANQAIQTQMGANNVANQYNQDVSNADQSNDGSERNYYTDAQGKVHQDTHYTGENAQIFQGGQDLSKEGLSQANNMLSKGFTQPTQNGSDVGLDNVTQAVFHKMRFGQDALDSQATEQQKQDLANRGIPVGSQAYNNAMNNLQNQQTINKQNAMDSATQQGTQAMATQAGVQNQYLTGQEGEVGALQGYGTGVYNAPMNQFNDVTYGAGQQNVMGVAPAYTQGQAAMTNANANMVNANVATGGLALANRLATQIQTAGQGGNAGSSGPPPQ